MNLPLKPKPAVSERRSEEEELQASAAPLLDHLTELRRRLLICVVAISVAFALCFLVSEQIFNILIIPFVTAVGKVEGADPTLYFAPLEFFFTRVKLAVFAAIAVSFPILAYQLYAFIAPGLYRREKQAAAPFIIAVPILFSLGACLVYFVMMPFVMTFAVGFEAGRDEGSPANYQLLTRVGDYLSLITTLMLGFGAAFQLPVFLTLLARVGMMSSQFLVTNRRVAVVVIFIIAAILTPPDPFSQIVLGLCILALYEISVIAVRLAEKKASAAREEAAA